MSFDITPRHDKPCIKQYPYHGMWLQEIGIPIFVASKTVFAVPTPTEAAKEESFTNASEINPFPEKFFKETSVRPLNARELTRHTWTDLNFTWQCPWVHLHQVHHHLTQVFNLNFPGILF